MATKSAARRTKYRSFAEVLKRVGGVPPRRLLVTPAPGTATEKDLIELAAAGDHLYELIGGIIVEKPMGWVESRLTALILRLIGNFVDEHNLGVVAGPDGGVQFKLNVRMPDVSFVSWNRGDDPTAIETPAGAFLAVPPDLAVEVLSESNTLKEMALKLDEYAKAGVKLVWYVDPAREEVDVYPRGQAKARKTLGREGVLDGGEVLPGFTLPVAKIFEKRAPAKKPGKKGKK